MALWIAVRGLAEYVEHCIFRAFLIMPAAVTIF